MRFVRLTTTIKRTCDADIRDLSEIRDILESVKNKELTVALRLMTGPLMLSVRITKTGNGEVAFSVIKNKSILRRTAKYEEVDYLEVHTKSEILVNKPNASRWDLLIDEEA